VEGMTFLYHENDQASFVQPARKALAIEKVKKIAMPQERFG
jgi:hypothetical protein